VERKNVDQVYRKLQSDRAAKRQKTLFPWFNVAFYVKVFKLVRVRLV
jgi:hypothetical protein